MPEVTVDDAVVHYDRTGTAPRCSCCTAPPPPASSGDR